MNTPAAADPTAVIRARVRELRARKGWSAAELGQRLAAVGVPWNRSVVANFESGRRPAVTVQEVFALALVLDVAPVHLIVPLDNRPYLVTPTRTEMADDIRAWVRGKLPLAGVDTRMYRAETSEQDLNERA